MGDLASLGLGLEGDPGRFSAAGPAPLPQLTGPRMNQ